MTPETLLWVDEQFGEPPLQGTAFVPDVMSW
jgi:hypothetical protein